MNDLYHILILEVCKLVPVFWMTTYVKSVHFALRNPFASSICQYGFIVPTEFLVFHLYKTDSSQKQKQEEELSKCH